MNPIKLLPCGSCNGSPERQEHRQHYVYCSTKGCPTQVEALTATEADKLWNALQPILVVFRKEYESLIGSHLEPKP